MRSAAACRRVALAADSFSLKSIKGMRENALWALGAVTGLVGVIEGLTKAFDLNAQAIARWQKERDGVNASLEKSRDVIAPP